MIAARPISRPPRGEAQRRLLERLRGGARLYAITYRPRGRRALWLAQDGRDEDVPAAAVDALSWRGLIEAVPRREDVVEYRLPGAAA